LTLLRNDIVYIDGMLPFGPRSAPKIFNAIADAIELYCVYSELCMFVGIIDQKFWEVSHVYSLEL